MSSNVFPYPGDSGYTSHGSLDRVPANVSMLADRPREMAPLSEIGFQWHPGSQHLAIKNFQPPSYYADYIMTTTYSEKMQELQRSQAAKLVSLYEKSGGPASFVEIGCGDASFLKHVKTRIGRVCGIEPSARFAAEARLAGFDVIDGYVGAATSLTMEKFDSFASRQVFEHLPDPQDVLLGVRKMLSPGAVGLIEVPNGQRALRFKRFFEFFPDHVNYYSVNSLVALATSTGFNVIGCHESFGGDYLELWVRFEPDVALWFEQMAAHRTAVCGAFEATLRELSARRIPVAVWGCGAKTLSILAATSGAIADQIAAVIDSDPHKQGKYVPNTSIPVVSPAAAAAFNPGVVFVLALSYREEIAAAVRERFPECRTILTLDDHGSVVNL